MPRAAVVLLLALALVLGPVAPADAPAAERRGVRVLVTGDSLTFGIPEALRARLRPTGGRVTADTNPGSGISKRVLVDWVAHAPRIAARVHPDVAFVFIGAAEDAEAMTTPAGARVVCCDAAWIAEYARRVESMMRAFSRRGRTRVLWALLPEPRPRADRPQQVLEFRAINAAIAQAAGRAPRGVEVVDEIAGTLAPGGYEATIRYGGRDRVVRAPDGRHLSALGKQIAASLIARRLRADGRR